VSETRILDIFVVESDQGLRSFNICEGDIFEQKSDLLVLSTHSTKRNAPTGWILTKTETGSDSYFQVSTSGLRI